MLTVAAVLLANTAPVQIALSQLPGTHLRVQTLAGPPLFGRVGVAAIVTVLAVEASRDADAWRDLVAIAGSLRALVAVVLVLATLGYFGVPSLPHTTLVGAIGLLAAALPAWVAFLERARDDSEGRTLVVGADAERISTALDAVADPIAGYASSTPWQDGATSDRHVDTDGGDAPATSPLAEYDRLGGLSRLDDLLGDAGIDSVVLVLPRTDRAEFFGILETCRRYGVDVSVPDEHDAGLLLAESDGGTNRLDGFSRVDVEPWSASERAGKRAFDVCFAALILCCTLPVFALAALAIRLDDGGPTFYTQERTTRFGDTFEVYKFRTMRPESERAAPGSDGDHITRVGRFLRRTHIDELPQFWAVLRGEMSVVGPRAAWIAEEDLLLAETRAWQKRWFVKPGLTGLAQIHGVSSETPREKIRYDLEYIRRRSLALDAWLVARQLWDVAAAFRSLVGVLRQGRDV